MAFRRTPEKDVDEELARLREDLARLRSSTPLSPKNGRPSSPPERQAPLSASPVRPLPTSPGSPYPLPAGSLEEIQSDLRSSADKYAVDMAEGKRRIDVLWKHYLAGEVRPDAGGQTATAALSSLSARVQRVEEDVRPRLRAVEEQAQAVSREVLRLGGLVERLGARELPEILDKVAGFEEARLHMADTHKKTATHAQVLEDQVSRVGDLARDLEAVKLELDRASSRSQAVHDLAAKTVSTVDALSHNHGAPADKERSSGETRRLEMEISTLRGELRDLRSGMAELAAQKHAPQAQAAQAHHAVHAHHLHSGKFAAAEHAAGHHHHEAEHHEAPPAIVVGMPGGLPPDVPKIQLPKGSKQQLLAPDSGGAADSRRSSKAELLDKMQRSSKQGSTSGRILAAEGLASPRGAGKRSKSAPPMESAPALPEGGLGARLWIKKRDHTSIWGKIGGYVTRYVVLDGAVLEWFSADPAEGPHVESRGTMDLSCVRQGDYEVTEHGEGNLTLTTPMGLRDVDFRPHPQAERDFLPFSVALTMAVDYGQQKYAWEIQELAKQHRAQRGAEDGGDEEEEEEEDD